MRLNMAYNTYALVLLTLTLFVGRERVVKVQGQLMDAECELTTAEGTQYRACDSQGQILLHSTEAGMFNFTVDPPEMTCGSPSEPFCTLSIVECNTCDSTVPEQSHPPEYMYDTTMNEDSTMVGNTNTWWQSKTMQQWYVDQGMPPGDLKLEANLTINFGHQYVLQDGIEIKFHSSRPKRMMLEVSRDNGQTWEPLQYYRENCAELYTDPDIHTPSSVQAGPTINNVICIETDSVQTPYTGGVVAFDVLDRMSHYLGEDMANLANLYNVGYEQDHLDAFLTFTDLRIRLEYPATSGYEDTREADRLIQIYYGISDIKITAGCFCNRHGRYCQETEGEIRCDCAHNTEGINCERCRPLFNNRPWQPGSFAPYPTGTANECQECECNEHADSCTYDPNRGVGVCDSCQHNTQGINCGTCMPTYYRNVSLLLSDPNVCADCNCEHLGVLGGPENPDLTCTSPHGECNCKNLVTGTRCDTCGTNYYGLLREDLSPGTCQPCGCSQDGTIYGGQTTTCDPHTGQCVCKTRIQGRTCDECVPGSYNFPYGRIADDCTDCGCDPGASTSPVCNTVTGACMCKRGISLRDCSSAITSFYVPAIAAHASQPVTVQNCEVDTAPITAVQSNSAFFTGREFVNCNENSNIQLEPIDGSTLQSAQLQMQYLPVLRYEFQAPEGSLWGFSTLTITTSGDSNVDITPYQTDQQDPVTATCAQGADFEQSFEIQGLLAGTGMARIVQSNLTLDVRCTYTAQLAVGASGLDQVQLTVDSVAYFPNYMMSQRYQQADAEQQDAYSQCAEQLAALGSRSSASQIDDCRKLMFSVGAEWHNGALPCNCNSQGTSPGTDCARLGGQCTCKSGVFGRQCDMCMPGFYNFTDRGCEPCECSPEGSDKLVCDYETGQCPCRENVATNTDTTTANTTGDRQCRYCVQDFFGHAAGAGCSACECNAAGSDVSQCDDLGVCICKETFGGDKCEVCLEGYFGFNENGCRMCNCTEDGSTGMGCDETTGQCTCKNNVQGLQCDTCVENTYNLREDNPDGCQPCFCYGHSVTCESTDGYVGDVVFSTDATTWESVTQENGVYYVRAPEEFLGDKMTSYSQYLRMRVMPRVELQVEEFKIIRLTGNNGEQIHYNITSAVIPVTGYLLEALLHESLWFYDDGTSPTPVQMYGILSDLEMLCVQRRYENPDSGSVTMIDLLDIGLESTQPATGVAGEVAVGFVETCTCNAETTFTQGQHCELCANGYQRLTTAEDKYEICRECNCNSNEQEGLPICNEDTGQCLNCRDGTTGFNCEACSVNVDPNSGCSQCLEQFWGLSQAGCVPCECDAVGSTSAVCDRDTGQCTCRSNVAGRTCGECADNYQGLTDAGCTECDSCYGLVGTAVDELRVMRDNITQYVEELAANDNNTELGAFSLRLSTTLTNLEILLNFLAQFTSTADRVAPQIETLNTTLLALRETLDQNVEGHIFTSNATLERANSVIVQVQAVHAQIAATVTSAYQLKTGTLDGLLDEMNVYVTALSDIQTEIDQLSTGALAEANQIMGYVREIEASATQATQIAQQSREILEEAVTEHENTTARLAALDTQLTETSTREAAVVSAADQARQNASASVQRADETLASADSLTSTPQEIIDAQQQRSAEMVALSNNQIQLAETSRNSTDQQYTAAVVAVETQNAAQQGPIDDQVNATAELEATLAEANEITMTARANASEVFLLAQNMHEVLRDFTQRTATVQAQVQAALASVDGAREESEAAIATAEGLMSELQSAHTLSSVAQEMAHYANQMATQQNQEIIGLMSQTTALHADSVAALSTIQANYSTILERNSTTVTAATQSCSALDSNVGVLQQLVTNARTQVDAATRHTSTMNGQISRLLADLNNIRQLDSADIQELGARVTAAQADLDSRQLASIVQQLQAVATEQQTRIDEMTAEKDQLAQQITHLRTIQGQLHVQAPGTG